MAEDIGIELHDKIKADFDVRCGKDSTLSHIKRKVEDGNATMEDTSVYARRLGENLRKSIESTTKPDDLPDGKMYYNIAQSILEPLLRGNYDDINAICAEVQSALDAKKGIGLKPQKADFPAERIRAAIGGAAVKETAEHAIQVLGRTAENITGSFQTDYIKKNAEFRSKAGLSCYIERKDGFRCCDWCAGLAGRYRYPDEVPKDVYRRHDNCTCDVSYVSEKGRQNVHSKKWANEQAKAQRIEYAANVQKPMKLTRAEAKELERKQLTKASDSVILRLKDTDALFHAVSDKAIRSVPLISVFGDKEKDEAHKKASQELLKVAKSVNKPVGTEIAVTYSSDMKRIIGMSIGDVGSVQIPPSNKPFHAFHNHGSDETFSFTDLLNFSMNNNMLSLTAQGNQGSKYVITSSANSDKEGYYLFLKAVSNEIIFSTDGADFTLDSIYGDNRARTQTLIQKMSENDFEKLKRAVTSKTDDCLKGVEDFDIKYFKTKVAD